MKIMVVGLGSMGKRRVRLLQKYIRDEVSADEKKNWIIYGVDSNPDRCSMVSREYGIDTYGSIEEASAHSQLGAAVVSTSPLSHAEIISDCLGKGMHVFTEINLIDDGYDKNIVLARRNNRVLFLSSTPVYRKEMAYIMNDAKEREFRGTYRYHVGQYLPEWHPWENYRDFFVGDKRTNGCREIFAIELPWMIKAYGEITECHSIHSKTTSLNIDYDDVFQVILRHSSGVTGSMTVDVSTPKSERVFSAWEENYYIEWKGTPDTLKKMDVGGKELKSISVYRDIEHTEGYNEFVVENAYYDELKAFVECIEMNKRPEYGFEDDKAVLAWIDEIMAGGSDD